MVERLGCATYNYETRPFLTLLIPLIFYLRLVQLTTLHESESLTVAGRRATRILLKGGLEPKVKIFLFEKRII